MIDECLKDKNKNTVRSMEQEFAISMYPKQVLQYIMKVNNEVNTGTMFSKLNMYFQYSRSSVKEIIGNSFYTNCDLISLIRNPGIPTLFLLVLELLKDNLLENMNIPGKKPFDNFISCFILEGVLKLNSMLKPILKNEEKVKEMIRHFFKMDFEVTSEPAKKGSIIGSGKWFSKDVIMQYAVQVST